MKNISFNETTNILCVSCPQNRFSPTVTHFVHRHTFLFIFLVVLIVSVIVGLSMFIMVTMSGPNTSQNSFFRRYARSKAFSVLSGSSKLSKWFTIRRFQQPQQQQQAQHMSDEDESDLFKVGQSYISTSEESDMSDNELVQTTDFRHVVLRN